MVESFRLGLETPDHIYLRNDSTPRQLLSIVRISFVFALELFFGPCEQNFNTKEEYWEITRLKKQEIEKEKETPSKQWRLKLFLFWSRLSARLAYGDVVQGYTLTLIYPESSLRARPHAYPGPVSCVYKVMRLASGQFTCPAHT